MQVIIMHSRLTQGKVSDFVVYTFNHFSFGVYIASFASFIHINEYVGQICRQRF